MERSLPTPIEEAGAAAAGGRLYVIGGFDAAGRSLATVYVFDGATWQAGPGLPLPVDHPSAATLDGSIYLAGGHSFGRDSARLFRLDGPSWTELASLHYARGGHALVAAQGRLYAFGGNTSTGNVAPTEVYDPAANSWTALPSLPTPRNHVSGFVTGTNVCVAGGRAPTTSRVDCFDTAGGAWTRLADLPRATSGGGATAFPGGGVVMMGGQNAQETAIVDQLTRFSTSAGWSTGDAMLVPRHGFELALFEDRAWACGGGTSPGLYPVATCTSVANPTPLTRSR
jgi:N-acetylneuraminic acid mutarotase